MWLSKSSVARYLKVQFIAHGAVNLAFLDIGAKFIAHGTVNLAWLGVKSSVHCKCSMYMAWLGSRVQPIKHDAVKPAWVDIGVSSLHMLHCSKTSMTRY